MVAIVDFGSQYTQVIARRVRELGVYSEIVHHREAVAHIRASKPDGVILSGGPASVYATKAPRTGREIFELGVPVLGICYGLQLLTHELGGRVARGGAREYGRGVLKIRRKSALFTDVPRSVRVWNSHGDKVTRLPKGFHAVAVTDNSPYAAVEDPKRRLFGLQFHPEVAHTEHGTKILGNFLFAVCGCRRTWTMKRFIDETCERVRAQVGRDRVILGLSGGVDSSVAAVLLHRAIGDQLRCIFVDNGLLRQGEQRAVRELFGKHFHMKLKVVDDRAVFLEKLAGVTDPERKRKIIGEQFIRTFERATAAAGRARYLAQGTLYPDVIESVPIGDNPAALIKSHHNVGGLPEDMKFELVEPLRQLFKDEVRKVGEELGLPREVVWRHPFPGPGLAVRCLGEITEEKLRILRESDAVVLEEMKASGWYYKVWQAFAVLLPVRSVGVQGDERSYDFTIAVRVVDSSDGMTADWVSLPHDLLGRISSRITNEVSGVNRVVFDVTSKPPGTIEWE
jgi:GMP synthase (glutamine-hydrolysing)